MCLWHTTKLSTNYCIQYMYSPNFWQISSFSSNRKAQNSAPSFQFMTPEQRIHQKSIKPVKFQHFQLPKETKFGPHPFHLQPRPSDLTKSMQKDMNFSTFQRMHSITPSEKHEIWNIKGSIFPFFSTNSPRRHGHYVNIVH